MNWFNKEKKESDDFDPYELDWGHITADGYKEGFALHVVCSNLENEACESKTKSFVVAKYKYYRMHFPPDCIHTFRFDIRGQYISDRHISTFKDDLYSLIEKNDNDPKFKIEF